MWHFSPIKPWTENKRDYLPTFYPQDCSQWTIFFFFFQTWIKDVFSNLTLKTPWEIAGGLWLSLTLHTVFGDPCSLYLTPLKTMYSLGGDWSLISCQVIACRFHCAAPAAVLQAMWSAVSLRLKWQIISLYSSPLQLKGTTWLSQRDPNYRIKNKSLSHLGINRHTLGALSN